MADLRMKFIAAKTRDGTWCAAAYHVDTEQFFVLNEAADWGAVAFAKHNGFDSAGNWQWDGGKCNQLADFFRTQATPPATRPLWDRSPVTLQFATPAAIDAVGPAS